MSAGEEAAISPVEREITDVTLEDVEVSCRDVVKFAGDLFTLGKIARAAFWLLLFFSLGYFYKLWLWVDMCVMQSAGVPCRDDFSLLTSPFPVRLGTVYGEDVDTSRSFFALDWPHVLCCFRTSVFLAMIYGVYRLLKWLLYPRLRALIVRHKLTVRRRELASRRQ